MGNRKSRRLTSLNQFRQQFLLSFFDEDKYSEKNVNGFWLIKQWNGDAKHWQVAIFSEESYKNYKAAASGELFKETDYGQHNERYQFLIGEF